MKFAAPIIVTFFAATSVHGDEQGGTPPVISEGFVSIWDGKSLKGWEQVLDSKWTVENGILISRQNPSGRLNGESWLVSKETYEDFILRLKFRVAKGGNSGVFIRDPMPYEQRVAAPDGGVGPYDVGYEINIDNDAPEYGTGSVWAIAKGAKHLERPGEWNDLLIKAKGDQVWTWVNGVPAVEGAKLPTRSRGGAIGFQRHGGPKYQDKQVEFRDIEIRKL